MSFQDSPGWSQPPQFGPSGATICFLRSKTRLEVGLEIPSIRQTLTLRRPGRLDSRWVAEVAPLGTCFPSFTCRHRYWQYPERPFAQRESHAWRATRASQSEFACAQAFLPVANECAHSLLFCLRVSRLLFLLYPALHHYSPLQHI